MGGQSRGPTPGKERGPRGLVVLQTPTTPGPVPKRGSSPPPEAGVLTASRLPPQVYRGHTSLVRCLSVSPSGQWLVSGKDSLPGPGHPGHAGCRQPGPGAGPSIAPCQRGARGGRAATLQTCENRSCRGSRQPPPPPHWGEAWAGGREHPWESCSRPRRPPEASVGFSNPTREPASLPLRSGEREAGGAERQSPAERPAAGWRRGEQMAAPNGPRRRVGFL